MYTYIYTYIDIYIACRYKLSESSYPKTLNPKRPSASDRGRFSPAQQVRSSLRFGRWGFQGCRRLSLPGFHSLTNHLDKPPEALQLPKNVAHAYYFWPCLALLTEWQQGHIHEPAGIS